MYTHHRISEHLKCHHQVITDFKEKHQERFPMKALLRSSLIALMLLGGYAGFAASNTVQHIPSLPTPDPPATR